MADFSIRRFFLRSCCVLPALRKIAGFVCSLVLIVIIFSSCASQPMIQPQINSLVVAGKFDYALHLLRDNPNSYGQRNRLLYFLDYALALHIAGRYEESTQVFESAKREFDKLFTVSISKEASTWLVNDSLAPYRGEDFERVMINVFQALNYVSMNNIEEALVEARDVDSKLSVINHQYPANAKNVYAQDAFVHMLMGIIYQAQKTPDAYNDAFISNEKSFEVYTKAYVHDYHVDPPLILKENLLATAEFMGRDKFFEYKNKFGNLKFTSLKDKENKSEIIVVHYYGLSPIKHQVSIPIPLPNGIISQLAFPIYDRRTDDGSSSILQAIGSDQHLFQSRSELGEDISEIAVQNLDNRKIRVITKALIRSGGKVVLEDLLSRNIQRKLGDDASVGFQFLSSFYNLVSEQADLRSWQTLPAKIYLSRLILDPGDYDVSYESKNLGHFHLLKGQMKLFIVRTN